MASSDYKFWWHKRQHEEPIPSNPYRAFMIDKGINAKSDDQRKWNKEPNRHDIDVDSSDVRRKQTKRPTSKRRHTKPVESKPLSYTPKHEAKHQKGQMSRKEVIRIAEEFTKEKGIPMPKKVIVSSDRGPLIGQMGTAWARKRGVHESYATPYAESSFLKVGTKGGRAQVKAVLYHELGHWADAHKSGTQGKFKVGGKWRRETAAWKEADSKLQDSRPVQKWTKRFALGSYKKYLEA